MIQPRSTPSGPNNLPGFEPERHIETSRLILRAWEDGDAPALKETIDRNLDHLMPWIPWASEHPKELHEILADVARFQREFRNGIAWTYGMYRNTDNALIGGIGLHPRIGVGGVEMGYWLDEHATGNGFVTEAATSLVDIAFAHHSVTHVEIRCDPRNAPSAAVPRRIGFQLVGLLEEPVNGRPGHLQTSMVWRKQR